MSRAPMTRAVFFSARSRLLAAKTLAARREVVKAVRSQYTGGRMDDFLEMAERTLRLTQMLVSSEDEEITVPRP